MEIYFISSNFRKRRLITKLRMMAHNLFKVKGRHFELPGPTPAVGSHCVRSRKTIPIQSPGATLAAGSHRVRSRKTLPIRITWSYTRIRSHVVLSRKNVLIRITWSYTRSRESVSNLGKLYPFESPGPTPEVRIYVVRCRKTLSIRISWSYTRSRNPCCPIQENIAHSNHLVLHPQ